MEFLRFFDEVVNRYPIRFELRYSHITDYTIRVWDDGTDEQIIWAQDRDLDYLLAKAQVMLKDWFCDNKGGY